MFRSLSLVILVAASSFVMDRLLNAAEDVLKASSESAAVLIAPEFAKDFDVDAAVAAYRAEDAKSLLIYAEKLGAAELAIGKKNQALSAVTLYRAAIQAAQERSDLKALDQIQKAIHSGMSLPASDQQTLLTELDLAKQLASASRRVDAGPGLKPNQVSAEAISLYNTFAKELRITQEYGTEEELRQLVDGIRQLRELHPKQRDHLIKMAGTALVAIRERDKVDSPLVAFNSVSRSLTSGLRILGPGEVTANGSVSLIVIATGPTSEKPAKIHLRGSRGVKVAESLEWNGHPLVIPSTILGEPGMPVFVSVGLTEKADSASWHAQIARQ
jgi:hypothetical protein